MSEKGMKKYYEKFDKKELIEILVKINIENIELSIDYYKMRKYCNTLEYQNKKLREQKHIYKTELGRCVRKLTRIYDYFAFVCILLAMFDDERFEDVKLIANDVKTV